MNEHYMLYKSSAEGITFKEQIKNHRDNLARSFLKVRLKNKNFTIVSNNCWGAEVYKDLQLPYTTPFVGLFLFAPCYLQMLNNLEYYLSQTLSFSDCSRYDFANRQRKEKIWDEYPIGLLDKNLEIHFMHYSSVSEAREKWNRRVKRINWDKDSMFIKFCDRGLCTENSLQEFDKLHFPNKVCFTAKKYSQFQSSIWIKESKNEPEVVEGRSLYKIGRKYFDVIDWLNGGSGHVRVSQRLINKIFY